MQLSRHSDYSLRVLMYLAVRSGERSTLKNIADYFNISINHLRKIVHELAKLGYVNTYQGKGGGIELGKSPDKINLGRLLERMEGGPLIDCEGLECRLSPLCTLNIALAKAQRTFFATLSEYNLSDLVSSKVMVRQLVATV